MSIEVSEEVVYVFCRRRVPIPLANVEGKEGFVNVLLWVKNQGFQILDEIFDEIFVQILAEKVGWDSLAEENIYCQNAYHHDEHHQWHQ